MSLPPKPTRRLSPELELPPDSELAYSGGRAVARGPLLGLVVVLVVWALAAGGILEFVDGPLYDLASRLRASVGSRSANVVLVTVPEEAAVAGREPWDDLLAALAHLGPRSVVFTFPPGDLTTSLRGNGGAAGWWYGRRILAGSSEGGLSLDAGGSGPSDRLAGVVAVAPATLGVHRRQRAGYEVGGVRFDSLEVGVARRLGVANLPAEGTFLIAFRGGPGALPSVDLDRALHGGLIADLVEDRVVLVGRITADATAGLLTPTTTGIRRMSSLELHGQALDGLLAGDRLRTLGSWLLLPLLLVLGGGGVVLYQRVSTRLTWRLTAALTVLYPLLAGVALVTAGLWVPPTPLVVTQVGLFSLFTWRKLAISSEAASQLLLEASTQLRQRLWPPHFYLTEEPWKQIALMTYQTLDLERVIFLEKLDDDERVREVEAVSCSLDDIRERRRDIRRTPYTTALEQEGPLRVDDYLTGGLEDEEQYLVPLDFGGRLHGFWAFGARSEVVHSTLGFSEVVEQISRELAEMLYHRHQVRRDLRPPTLLERLSRERQEESYRALAQVFRFLETRIERVENMVAGMSTGAVLYDLFGHVLEISGKMREVLRREGLAPYSVTGVDLVASLGGVDLGTARGALRGAILRRETVRMPAVVQARDGELPLYLVVRPLIGNGGEAKSGSPSPFGLSGIVIELAVDGPTDRS